MKLKNIFKTLPFAAVALLATACNDTDAQYEVAVASLPDFVAVTPTEGTALLYGEKTIKVKFNRLINFATKDADKITLNGKSVKKALVLGPDSSLTIIADINFDRKQNLVIPANLIANSQGAYYDKELSFTWEIKDLPSNEATAMTQRLGWGFNLGNHFDTDDTSWGYWDGATPTQNFYQALAAKGAKTIRIPTTWTNHMDDNGIIDPAYMDEVAQNVDWAIAAGLNVILNTHHDSFESSSLGNAATNPAIAAMVELLIENLWTQIATKFANYGDQLMFETFNEVHNGDDWNKGSDAQFSTLNHWNQVALDAIRATGGNNATRWIGVSGYAANIDLTVATKDGSDELKNFQLPNDPAKHVMVSVHCYDPYLFCQSPYDVKGDSIAANSWGHNADPIHSTAGANEEYILAQIYKLRTTFIEKGIPVYLGEYGCVNQLSDNANAFRKYYFEYFCRCANIAGIPVIIWDNNVAEPGNERFGVIDHTTGDYIGQGADLVPMMIRATTLNDTSYSLYTVWDNSPVYDGK